MMIRRKKREGGSAVVEFALSTMFWVPLLVGTSVVGTNLMRALQIAQVTRDAGHMYAYGVDFSLTANKAILVRLAKGLDISADGGSGAVVLSTITRIGTLQCAAGGLTVERCPNYNHAVLVRRIVVGNPNVGISKFVTPQSNVIGSSGYIPAATYLTNASVRAPKFANLLTLPAGQPAHMAETRFNSTDVDWGTVMAGGVVYDRVIF